MDNSESSALPLKVEVRTVSPSVLFYEFEEILKILLPNLFSLIFIINRAVVKDQGQGFPWLLHLYEHDPLTTFTENKEKIKN